MITIILIALITFLIRIFGIRVDDFPDIYNPGRIIENDLIWWPFDGLTDAGSYACKRLGLLENILFGGLDLETDIWSTLVPRLLLFIPLLLSSVICFYIKESLLKSSGRGLLNSSKHSPSLIALRLTETDKLLTRNLRFAILLPSTAYFICGPGRESVAFTLSLINGYSSLCFFTISGLFHSLQLKVPYSLGIKLLLPFFLLSASLLIIPFTSDNQYFLLCMFNIISLLFIIFLKQKAFLDFIVRRFLPKSSNFINSLISLRFPRSLAYFLIVFTVIVSIVSLSNFFIVSSLTQLPYLGASFDAYSGEYSDVLSKYPVFIRIFYLMQSSLLLTLCSLSFGYIILLFYLVLVSYGFLKPLPSQPFLFVVYRFILFSSVILLVAFMPGYAYYKYWIFLTPFIVSLLQPRTSYSYYLLSLCWLLLLFRSVANLF